MKTYMGVISDIHAELPALQRALDLFDRLGIDQIVCAGDLVEKGSQGDAVVALLQERNITSVAGNHDVFAVENQYWLLSQADPDHPNYPRLLRQLLSKESHQYLQTLPQRTCFEVAGKRILLAHGTPARNDEYLFFHSPDLRFRELLHDYPADVLILGHTHEPMVVQVQPDVWVVNPGAVCFQQSRGSGTCAVMSLPAFNFRIFDLRTGSKAAVNYREI